MVNGDENDIRLIIDEDTTEIICALIGRPTVWPTRGIIRVRNHYFHYTNFSNNTFSNLTYIPRQRVFDLDRNRRPRETYNNPDSWRANPALEFRASNQNTERRGPLMYLVSMELRNSDGLLDPDALRPPERNTGWRVIQIEDQNTGRIEWIDYNGVNVDTGVPYLIHRSGWNRWNRGNGRTVFMGEFGQPETIWKSERDYCRCRRK